MWRITLGKGRSENAEGLVPEDLAVIVREAKVLHGL
jgi:hypothetical protein